MGIIILFQKQMLNVNSDSYSSQGKWTVFSFVTLLEFSPTFTLAPNDALIFFGSFQDTFFFSFRHFQQLLKKIFSLWTKPNVGDELRHVRSVISITQINQRWVRDVLFVIELVHGGCCFRMCFLVFICNTFLFFLNI